MFSEVTDMLVFAAVARAGSLTRGGHALGLPKSTVSRRIATLEERVGSRLLHKTTRRLVLTEAGEAFLEHCQKLADEAEEALSFASELSSEPRGTLRITMPPDLGDVRLHEAIGDFAERYPKISIVLDESERFVDLNAERVDVAIRAGALDDSSLVARKLCELPGGLFASPSYVKRYGKPRTPADLASHRFVVLQGRTRFDNVELRRGDQRSRVQLAAQITANSGSMLVRLGAAGVGAFSYPVAYTAEAVEAGKLVRLLPAWSTPPALLWLVTPSRRLLPRKTSLFIEHLTGRFHS
jgi:DNA-binding transcriptional LysR family regulator